MCQEFQSEVSKAEEVPCLMALWGKAGSSSQLSPILGVHTTPHAKVLGRGGLQVQIPIILRLPTRRAQQSEVFRNCQEEREGTLWELLVKALPEKGLCCAMLCLPWLQ